MNEAFRWTLGIGSVRLGRFEQGSNSVRTATAVSADGRIIGGTGHPALTGAVVWDASDAPTITGGLPGDTNGSITALSGDGTVAAGVSSDAASHQRAFRWNASRGPVPLSTTGTFVATIATAISADGRRNAEFGEVGRTVWTPPFCGTNREHCAPYPTCLPAMARPQARAGHSAREEHRGISADGRVIVGEGIDPEGAPSGWVVTLSE